MHCEKEHFNHKRINLGDILPGKDESKQRIKELGKRINQLNVDIDNIIKKLNFYRENMNKYYQIYKNIMTIVDNKNRSYELLNNMIEINNNDIMNDIHYIIEEKNIKNKVNLIFDIIDKKENFDNDAITLVYKVNENDKEIQILNSMFVQNNKNICKIIYNNEEMELTDRFNVESVKEKLKIKLKGFHNIIYVNQMFYGCKALIEIPDFYKWNLSDFYEKSQMFYGCNSLLNIPDNLKK
jgi:hypothetical protein